MHYDIKARGIIEPTNEDMGAAYFVPKPKAAIYVDRCFDDTNTKLHTSIIPLGNVSL